MKKGILSAYLFAKKAHKGQVDKAGETYINHPVRVAKRVKTKQAKIVALLHDVVEDTEYTIQDIRERFGNSVAKSVQLLTRNKKVDYMTYLVGVLEDPIATQVKMADLLDNMFIFRLKENTITREDINRCEQYATAYCTLLNFFKH